MVIFLRYIGPAYKQQQKNLVYKQQQNVLFSLAQIKKPLVSKIQHQTWDSILDFDGYQTHYNLFIPWFQRLIFINYFFYFKLLHCFDIFVTFVPNTDLFQYLVNVYFTFSYDFTHNT